MKQLIALASILALSACSSDNDSNDTVDNGDANPSYKVAFANLSNAQPISPPIAILHEAGFSLWKNGQAASVALEHLAESGDASSLQTEAGTRANKVATGVLLSGTSDNLTLDSLADEQQYLTVAGMLVNTNDAFTGINAIDVSGLAIDHSYTLLASVYDAGTEANSENVNTIPGPAAGGEGFASERDDITAVVTHHSGVVSVDDGYAESSLTQAHRFDGPVMKITITRIK